LLAVLPTTQERESSVFKTKGELKHIKEGAKGYHEKRGREGKGRKQSINYGSFLCSSTAFPSAFLLANTKNKGCISLL